MSETDIVAREKPLSGYAGDFLRELESPELLTLQTKVRWRGTETSAHNWGKRGIEAIAAALREREALCSDLSRMREALEKIVGDPFGTDAEETHNETYEEPFDCVRRFQDIARAALSPAETE